MAWKIVGQDTAVSLLQRGLERGMVSHAYLLVGPAHVGKMTLALELACALNCQADEPPCGECSSCRKIAEEKHADVQVIGVLSEGESDKDKSRVEIGVGQIEQLQHQASLPPFEGRCKVFIIDGAESLSHGAANRLLKTLEEPVERVVFVLLTVNDRLLPETIVSRCQRLELPPLALADVEVALGDGCEPEQARLLARLSRGRLGWAMAAADDAGLMQKRADMMDKLDGVLDAGGEDRFTYAAQLATQFGKDRRAALDVLGMWLDYWRDMLLVKIGCGDAVTNADMITELQDRAGGYSLGGIRSFIGSIQAAVGGLKQNANPRLALEVLMLDIPERGR